MTIHEFYHTVGGDYADVFSRFQNDTLTAKFLRMIPRDESINLLENAVAANDATSAFRAVHTLKGVALNLGLSRLASACSDMAEALRGSDTLPASAAELGSAVRAEYDAVRSALEQLDA